MTEHLVYVISGDGWCKVGVTQDLEMRLRQISSTMVEPVRAEYLFGFSDRVAAEAMEKMAHALLFRIQHFGEWFVAEPGEVVPMVRAAEQYFVDCGREMQAGDTADQRGAGRGPRSLVQEAVSKKRSAT